MGSEMCIRDRIGHKDKILRQKTLDHKNPNKGKTLKPFRGKKNVTSGIGAHNKYHKGNI